MQNNNELQREADEAVRVLKEGGIILYPTDTVWGLGCDATNAEAVERIYKLKRSENKKSMLVLCASADMVVRYVNRAPGIAFEVMELATSPLTAILPLDAAAFLIVLATLLTILAGLIPAMGAAKSNPVKALRSE